MYNFTKKCIITIGILLILSLVGAKLEINFVEAAVKSVDYLSSGSSRKTSCKHAYRWVIKVKADCKTKGRKEYKCVKCGYASKSMIIEKTSHKYKWITTKNATCTVAGTKMYKCQLCQHISKTQLIKALGHTGRAVTVKNATCTASGLKQTTCTRCSKIYDKTIVSAFGHKGVWKVVKNATCATVGKEERKCTNCAASLDTREIPKIAHVYVKKYQSVSSPDIHIVIETCKKCNTSRKVGEYKHDFNSNNVCKYCRYVKKAEVHVHDYETTLIEPNCQKTGQYKVICKICGDIKEDKVIPKSGHSYNLNLVCDVCGGYSPDKVLKIGINGNGSVKCSGKYVINNKSEFNKIKKSLLADLKLYTNIHIQAFSAGAAYVDEVVSFCYANKLPEARVSVNAVELSCAATSTNNRSNNDAIEDMVDEFIENGIEYEIVVGDDDRDSNTYVYDTSLETYTHLALAGDATDTGVSLKLINHETEDFSYNFNGMIFEGNRVTYTFKEGNKSYVVHLDAETGEAIIVQKGSNGRIEQVDEVFGLDITIINENTGISNPHEEALDIDNRQ